LYETDEKSHTVNIDSMTSLVTFDSDRVRLCCVFWATSLHSLRARYRLTRHKYKQDKALQDR